MDIYPSYGIDDIGSCIDYLVKEAWWEKKEKFNRSKGIRGHAYEGKNS